MIPAPLSLASCRPSLALLVAILCIASPVRAAQQSDDDDEPRSGSSAEQWKLEGGAGAALRPYKRGDNRYIFSPFPLARLSYGELLEASTRDGISHAVFSSDSIRLGPELEIDRKERQSARRLGPASIIFGTGGVGGFADWKLPADSRLRLDVTEGVFGREGLRVVLSGVRTYTISEPLSLDLGFKGTGGNRRYVASAYGFPESRKAPYLPMPFASLQHGSAGVTAIGPTLAASYTANSRDVVTSNLELSRVIGTASHTPAVRNVGTRNALSLELSWRRTLFESN